VGCSSIQLPFTFYAPVTFSPSSDDFEGYALSSEAAYFSDMSGAFEIIDASAYGRSQAMQQVTPLPPIAWQRPNYAPHSIIGDSWFNIATNVSVLLTDASHTAALGVRMQQIDSMNGVWLAVNGSMWSVYSSLQDLAGGGPANYSGPLFSPLAPGSWHTLALVAAEAAEASVYVDGALIAALNVSSFVRGGGWVALATAAYGQTVLFDDFSINLP
jgi:hypothetical protein